MRKKSGFVAAAALYVVFYLFVASQALERTIDFSSYLAYAPVIFRGWLTTIAISLVSLILAILVGLILYLMRESKFSVLFYLAEIHKTIIFGTPLVVLAMVAYFYIGDAFGIKSKFWVGAIALAFYIGAYIADIYKGAVESIHINQWQTAKMFGFTRYQTYRYVVLPQVITSILPPLTGQLTMTIKSSAILAYMATDEFLNTIRTVQAIGFRYPEGFMITILGYLILTVPLIVLVGKLEKKLNYKV
ncbi:amino acid ABC transporter permease [Fusibacter tunisiensis]|jgi:polar amino acid transport system permease protein|uniref:Polar amino acid transport system permease protein n=1 Tax=Fusibacter tunisiensis TaxID=1008308 RepID=A0ABS2MT14_9FIRM|nr:amino acid ABC transporter permease [Fusibacter tunisiensis]MBM7562546.1 polar amino acid transport system permease protein [Fusibacter tunisiensis]